MTANVNLGFDIPLQKNVTGTITGLTATVPIVQSLGFIHKLPINGNSFSLSVQGQNLRWPGAAGDALRGWWMAFEDQIDIGSISPASAVPITDAVLSQALGPEGVRVQLRRVLTVRYIKTQLSVRLLVALIALGVICR
jgi:hypothetical protein